MRHFDELDRRIRELEAVIDDWIAKFNMGYNHFAVLYSLAVAENGECTQKAICDEWWLPKQTVFNVCKEYKEKGWIEFSESETDKRAKMMRLTAAGKAKAEPILATTEQFGDKVFAAFGEKKTKQLFALLAEFSEVSRQQMDKIDVEAIKNE